MAGFASCARIGALLWVWALLFAPSLIGPHHLLGAALFAAGLLGLAWNGRMGEVLARGWPGPRAFWSLFALVGAGHALLIWACLTGMNFSWADTGAFGERFMALALHGEFWFGSAERHGFADHFCPALCAFAPLYRLWPTFLWMPLAKACAALATALILVPLSRETLGPESRARRVIPVLYLVHAALNYGWIRDFQPSQLAPPFIAGAFLAARRERGVPLALCLLVLAALKEDLLLVWVCVGGYLALERRRPVLGAAIATAGIVTGIAILAVVMPAFNGGVFFHAHRMGLRELLPQKASVVLVSLASLGGLPLARPRTLLWAMPAYAVHAMTAWWPVLGWRDHYQILPLTVLLVAALEGLAALERGEGWTAGWPRRARAVAAALSLGLLAGMNGMLPHYAALMRWPQPDRMRMRADAELVRARLPVGPKVYADDPVALWLLPHPRVCVLVMGYWPARTVEQVVVMGTLGSDFALEEQHILRMQEVLAEVRRGEAEILADTPRVIAFRRFPASPAPGPPGASPRRR